MDQGFIWLACLGQDVRNAARTLRHRPGFSIAAVLSLALGIGASTTVFSIADAIFIRPLPYVDSERLVWVGVDFPSFKVRFNGDRSALSAFVPSPDYVAWRRENRVFGQLAAGQAGLGGPMILGGIEPAEVHVWRVSYNFLPTFGVTPSRGRNFTAGEELPNGPKAAILSDQLWRNHFHNVADIVGRVILLDGQPYTVVGILPPRFVLPADVKIDILTTLPVSPTATHHDRAMATWGVFGRLKPNISVAQARAELETLFAASRADAPLLFRSDNVLMVEPLQQHRVGNVRLLLSVLVGAVACLLLIACANVANLLLASWSTRSRELAVRAAIGAARSRLVRQLFIEASLIAALGSVAGMVLVAIALRAFVHFAAGELPRVNEVSMDARVLGIAVLVSLVTTLVFGGLPAVRAGKVDIQSVLQHAGRLGMAGGYRRSRRALVAAEIALSLVLVSGASLLLQTLWHLENDHLGFQPEHVTTIALPLRGTKFENRNREALARDLLAYLKRLPGTEAAALTRCLPLAGFPQLVSFSRSDRPLPEPFGRSGSIGVCDQTSEYFRAAGIRVERGRVFTEEDYDHPATLAVINEAAARAYFPGEDPLGKQIGHDPQGRWKTVIGIVSDAKNQDLKGAAEPQMYVNDLVYPDVEHVSEFHFILRSTVEESALAANIRAEIRSLDPSLYPKLSSLKETISEIASGARFNSVLLTSFAGVAFMMAIFGVYGVLAFAVAQRTAEIGIRIALGAAPGRVLALVLREGTVLVATGAVAGLGGALILSRYLKTLLFDVSATDPVTYVAAALGLGAAAMLATLIPARRAASVDPMLALRHD